MTNKKKHLPNNRRCFPKTKDQFNYFLVGAVAGALEFDDFIVEFEDVVFAGFIALLVELLVVVMLDGIVLVVATGAGVLAGVEGLVLALLAGVSPQAIPIAPNTRTADKAIIFFIKDSPIFSKIRSNFKNGNV